jgi:hypothetical protein
MVITLTVMVFGVAIALGFDVTIADLVSVPVMAIGGIEFGVARLAAFAAFATALFAATLAGAFASAFSGCGFHLRRHLIVEANGRRNKPNADKSRDCQSTNRDACAFHDGYSNDFSPATLTMTIGYATSNNSEFWVSMHPSIGAISSNYDKILDKSDRVHLSVTKINIDTFVFKRPNSFIFCMPLLPYLKIVPESQYLE